MIDALQMVRSPRRRAGWRHRGLMFAAAAGVFALVPAGSVHAQGGRSTMVQADDAGTRVLTWSMPDRDGLTAPDVRPEDLPHLARILSMSEPQADIARGLLETYVRNVAAIPFDPPNPGRGPGQGAGDEGEAGEASDDALGQLVDRTMRDAMTAAGLDPARLDSDELDVNLGIGISMEQSGPDTPPVPAIDVTVRIGPAEGVSLPKAELEALEAVARATAEAIEAHARKQSIEDFMGGLQGDGGGGGGDARWDEAAEASEAMRDAVRAYLRERAIARAALDSGLRSILADAQQPSWPAADRWILRHSALPRGEIAGESLDVIAAAERLIERRPDVADALAELLPELELQVHTALSARERRRHELAFGIDEACAAGDPAALRRASRAARDLRVRVRDANLRAVDTIAAVLADVPIETAEVVADPLRDPADAGRDRTSVGAAFAADLRRTAFPAVWAETPAQRAFKGVADRPLDESIRAVAVSIAEDYVRRHGEAGRRLERLVLDTDPKRLDAQVADLIDALEGVGRPAEVSFDTGATDAVVTAFQRRLALDREAMQRLYGLLDPAIVAALPPLPEIADLGPVEVRLEGGRSGRDDT